jgi:ribonuclease J
MANVMKAFKYVFVLASATDIERLASIKNASSEAKKTLYLCSKFIKICYNLKILGGYYAKKIY